MRHVAVQLVTAVPQGRIKEARSLDGMRLHLQALSRRQGAVPVQHLLVHIHLADVMEGGNPLYRLDEVPVNFVGIDVLTQQFGCDCLRIVGGPHQVALAGQVVVFGKVGKRKHHLVAHHADLFSLLADVAFKGLLVIVQQCMNQFQRHPLIRMQLS